MKGLIFKDFVNIKSQLKMYIIFVAGFFVLGMVSGATEVLSALMPMLAVLIPITAVAYDDLSGWNGFALSMPVSRADLVTARYLFTEMIMVAMAVITCAEYIAVSRNIGEAVMTTVLLYAVSNLMFAVIMPIILKFGVQKARAIFMVIAAGAAALIVWLSGDRASAIGDAVLSVKLNDAVIFAIALAGSLLLVFISMKLSQGIYRRKDF